MKRIATPPGIGLLTSIRRTTGWQIDRLREKFRGRPYSARSIEAPKEGGSMRYVSAILALAFASTSGAQVDNATVTRIIDEELNHSELPQTAAYLTDRIGGRMT